MGLPPGRGEPHGEGLDLREHSPARPRILDLTHGFAEPQILTPWQALFGLRKRRMRFGLPFLRERKAFPHGMGDPTAALSICPYGVHIHGSSQLPSHTGGKRSQGEHGRPNMPRNNPYPHLFVGLPMGDTHPTASAQPAPGSSPSQSRRPRSD